VAGPGDKNRALSMIFRSVPKPTVHRRRAPWTATQWWWNCGGLGEPTGTGGTTTAPYPRYGLPDTITESVKAEAIAEMEVGVGRTRRGQEGGHSVSGRR
jgi:hypothetical protein